MQHYDIRERLMKSIDFIVANVSQYVYNKGHDLTRSRKLPLPVLLMYLLQKGASYAGHELRCFFKELSETPTVSALCQQRAKLKPEALYDLFMHFTQGLYQMGGRPPKWHFIAVDGCRVSFNDWKGEKSGRWRVCQGKRTRQEAHVVSALDINRGYMLGGVIQPVHEQDERDALYQIAENFIPMKGSTPVFMTDRGFPSWNSIARIAEKQWGYLYRVNDKDTHGSMLSTLPLPADGTFDVSLNLRLVRKKSAASAADPEHFPVLVRSGSRFDPIPYGSDEYIDLPVRVIRYRLPKSADRQENETSHGCIITNLPVKSFSTSKIVHLYARRWRIETAYRHEKSTLALESFQSVKPCLVMQEIWAKLAIYNFVAALQHFAQLKADQRQKAKRAQLKHKYRVEYSEAASIGLAWLRRLRREPDAREDDLLVHLSRETYAVRNNRDPVPRGNTKRRTTVPLTHRPAI